MQGCIDETYRESFGGQQTDQATCKRYCSRSAFLHPSNNSGQLQSQKIIKKTGSK